MNHPAFATIELPDGIRGEDLTLFQRATALFNGEFIVGRVVGGFDKHAEVEIDGTLQRVPVAFEMLKTA